mgnify:CR=1 FL=1
MNRISPKRKASVLAKLLSPFSMTIASSAQMEGMPESTLYNWRHKVKIEGKFVPGTQE